MDDDARRWDERYAGLVEVDRRPPEALERWAHLAAQLPTHGRCVDLACGPGAVALWLAERGLHVTALDVSPVAIDVLRSCAERAGVGERIDARVTDLDEGIPGDLRDLELIVCQRFRSPALYPALLERLNPGGLVVVTVLSAVGCERPGAFHAPPGELRAAFTSEHCDIVLEAEGGGLGHLVARRR